MTRFIDDASAGALRDELLRRHDWRVSFGLGNKRQLQFERDAWDNFSANERAGIAKLAWPAQEKGFRYWYDELGAGEYPQNTADRTSLDEFARFISSPPVLELVRYVSGCSEITEADARATRYVAGHFLTAHDDGASQTHRRVAYVFGLTPNWRPEWGGLLLFHDDRGEVECGLVPRMNTLNLFAIPKRHSVSLVSPFAPVPRLAVSGWFSALPAE